MSITLGIAALLAIPHPAQATTFQTRAGGSMSVHPAITPDPTFGVGAALVRGEPSFDFHIEAVGTALEVSARTAATWTPGATPWRLRATLEAGAYAFPSVSARTWQVAPRLGVVWTNPATTQRAGEETDPKPIQLDALWADVAVGACWSGSCPGGDRYNGVEVGLTDMWRPSMGLQVVTREDRRGPTVDGSVTGLDQVAHTVTFGIVVRDPAAP